MKKGRKNVCRGLARALSKAAERIYDSRQILELSAYPNVQNNLRTPAHVQIVVTDRAIKGNSGVATQFVTFEIVE